MITYIASIESFLGSLWFAGLTFCVGYGAGHIGLMGKLVSKISRPK